MTVFVSDKLFYPSLILVRMDRRFQWKRINHKQIARWQHLSHLKASAFLFEIILLGIKKHNNLYLKLVTPSGV
jgi:hypothetical protein